MLEWKVISLSKKFRWAKSLSHVKKISKTTKANLYCFKIIRNCLTSDLAVKSWYFTCHIVCLVSDLLQDKVSVYETSFLSTVFQWKEQIFKMLCLSIWNVVNFNSLRELLNLNSAKKLVLMSSFKHCSFFFFDFPPHGNQ